MEKAAGWQGQQAIEKVQHRSKYRNEYPVPDKGGVVGPHQGDQNGGGQGDLHEQIAQQLGGGDGEDLKFYRGVSHGDEQKQAHQIGEDVSDVQHGSNSFHGGAEIMPMTRLRPAHKRRPQPRFGTYQRFLKLVTLSLLTKAVMASF